MSEVLGFSEEVAPEDAVDGGLPDAAPANEQAMLFDDAAAFMPEPARPEGGGVAHQPLLGDAEAFAAAGHDVRYGLVEVGDLIASHDVDLHEVPDHQTAVGSRPRERALFEQQVQAMVRDFDPAMLGPSEDADTGAPVVGPGGLVEQGNARAVTLQRVYRADGQKAADYREYLREKVPALGIPAEMVDVLRKPVLVRVLLLSAEDRLQEVDRVREEAGHAHNQQNRDGEQNQYIADGLETLAPVSLILSPA